MKVNKIAYEIHKASGTLEKYRGQLVANVLNALGYDINYQIAIGFDKDIKPEEYNAYQAIRAECKARVDAWFAEMEQPKEYEKLTAVEESLIDPNEGE